MKKVLNTFDKDFIEKYTKVREYLGNEASVKEVAEKALNFYSTLL